MFRSTTRVWKLITKFISGIDTPFVISGSSSKLHLIATIFLDDTDWSGKSKVNEESFSANLVSGVS